MTALRTRASRVLLPVLALAAGTALAAPARAQICNGAAELCDRPYDAVAVLTTHNAHASREDGYVLFNGTQTHGIATQLADGVRGLMLDVYEFEGEVTLCHGPCELANQPLAGELETIRDFLLGHPGEVVTIIFESYVSAARLAEVFEAVGLLDPAAPGDDMLHAHAGGAWPTLGEMVGAGEQLVVFSDRNEQSSYPWHHYLWSSLVFETHWDVGSISEFSCADNRGSPGNDLFILNHFITGPIGGTPNLAGQANANPFFRERALECQGFHGRIPNFVTVDFYEIGDGLAVVDALNGVGPACSDGDGDGYGAPASASCTFPELDCDDGDPAVNPGAAEIPGNGVDDDCDPATPGGCGGA